MKDYFVLPSLAVLSRRVSPSRVFEDDELTPLLLVALQQGIASLGALLQDVDYRIAYIESVPAAFARTLHDALELPADPVPIDGDIASPAAFSCPPDVKLILLCDLLASGYTAERQIRRIRKAGHEVSALAVILDVRRDPQPSIEIYGRNVPVVGVVSQPLQMELDASAIRQSKRATYTDVGGAGRLLPEPLQLATRISGQEILDICSSTKAALMVGHFARSPTRHLTSYVDVDALLRAESELHGATTGAIDAWLKEAEARGLDVSGVTVYYPDDDLGFARSVVDVVVGHIAGTLPCGSRRMTRREQRGELYFELAPPSDGQEQPTHALFIDWGAVTNRTIVRAMSVIADMGHAELMVMLLTSQLRRTVEDDLLRRVGMSGRVPPEVTQLSLDDAIEGSGDSDDDEGAYRTTAVQLEIVCELPVPVSDPSQCGPCTTTAELRTMQPLAPTTFLRSHIENKLRELEPSNVVDALEAVRADGASYVFSDRVESAATTRMLELRTMLEDAAKSSETGIRLVEELTDEILGGSDRTSMLRLLSIEPRWLHCLPLDLPKCRDAIALSCVGLLTQEGTSTQDAWVAAMVLRSAQKRRLVQRFPDLLTRWHTNPTVAGELLLGVLTLLAREYHREQSFMKSVVRALSSAATRLEECTPGVFRDAVLDTTRALWLWAESELLAAGAPADPLEAWDELRRGYLHKMGRHPRVSRSVLVVQDSLAQTSALGMSTGSGEEGPLLGARETVSAWHDCSSFLLRNVIPLLQPIRETLGSVPLELTPRDPRTMSSELADWNSAVRFLTREQLFAFGTRLELAVGEGALAVDSQRELPAIRRDFRHWYEFFLEPPEYDGEARSLEQSAHLFAALSDAPVSIADCLSAALREAKVTGLVFQEEHSPGDDRDSLAFCSGHLLRDAIEHAVLNAAGEKHRLKGVPDAGPTITFDVSIRDGGILVTITNNWTRPSTHPGAGLSEFDQLLASWGGSMAGKVLVGDAWAAPTFEQTIRLRPWTAPTVATADA